MSIYGHQANEVMKIYETKLQKFYWRCMGVYVNQPNACKISYLRNVARLSA